MRIGMDTSRTAETRTGLGAYAQSLFAAMAAVDHANEFVLYPFVWDCYPPNWPEAFCPAQKNFRLAHRRSPKSVIRRRWDRSADKSWLVDREPDVYFSPFHSAPPHGFRRLVCVFHDISFRVHPEFSTPENRDHCERHFAGALAAADRMITVSHFSKQEIVDQTGVDPDWIAVTHEAADPMFHRADGCTVPERLRRELGDAGEFILIVGSIEPRKNVDTLVKAFDRLVRRGDRRTKLVIAGGSGWMNSHVFEEIERRQLQSRVHFTGFVTDQELLQLYNTCRVFVFPTIYEGFGLPVVEAMSCGAPVITSRVASIPEVGGDAVLYVDDPLDDVALSERIGEVLESRELQEDLRRRGLAQAGRFTWERTARETLAVIDDAHRNPGLRRYHIEMGQCERGLGRGFHELEHDGGRAYRWSQREATVRLCPAGSHLIVAAASSVPGEEQILAVRVQGQLVGHAALRGEWQTFRFPVSLADHRDRDGEVDIALSVNFELPPALKGSDARSLGARIARVGFEPPA